MLTRAGGPCSCGCGFRSRPAGNALIAGGRGGIRISQAEPADPNHWAEQPG
jgi:hypothetical protein